MGTTILLAAIVLAVSPGGEPENSSEVASKGYHEYSREMKTSLRAEAIAKTQLERGNAILALTNLYAQLRTDERFESSEVLQSMKNKIWARLTHIRDDLERTLARQREAEKLAAKKKEKSRSRTKSSRSTAQPAGGARVVRGGRAIIPDFGQALVDLIERTIAPGKWDTTGGPFSIVYFAPRRALVVRATGELHHNLNGVLKAVRAAGP